MWFDTNSTKFLFKEGPSLFVNVRGECVFCRNAHEVHITPLHYEEALTGNVTNICPVTDREFLISGICKNCQSGLFENVPDENLISQKVFVTNATARSVSFYAMSYLNNRGYSSDEIMEIRKKLSIDDMGHGKFTVSEVLSSFTHQSIYFLELYRNLFEGEFEQFVHSLEKTLYKKIFSNHPAPQDLFKHFNRRVYHTSLDCESMLSHFSQNNRYFKNTGVFANRLAQAEPDYYQINAEYLEKMGMRICRICQVNLT